jgi:hypothetical protein
MIIVRMEPKDCRNIRYGGQHFESDLDTANFIVEHLPRNDGFTLSLRAAIKRVEDERNDGDKN